jgi:hypothetical protein
MAGHPTANISEGGSEITASAAPTIVRLRSGRAGRFLRQIADLIFLAGNMAPHSTITTQSIRGRESAPLCKPSAKPARASQPKAYVVDLDEQKAENMRMAR